MTRTVAQDRLAWNDHASFKGVALKHLIKGEKTGGKFSVHMVRVKAGYMIGDHIHEGKWEMHEVVSGKGSCDRDGVNIHYEPGVIAIIPENINHRVTADGGDLYLLATFVPALL